MRRDPREERVRIPAYLVELADREQCKIRIVSDERQIFLAFEVSKTDAAPRRRI